MRRYPPFLHTFLHSLDCGASSEWGSRLGEREGVDQEDFVAWHCSSLQDMSSCKDGIGAAASHTDTCISNIKHC